MSLEILDALHRRDERIQRQVLAGPLQPFHQHAGGGIADRTDAGNSSAGGLTVLRSAASARRCSAGGTMVSYCISKTALIGLSRSLAYDYGVDNIRSNVICPGWTESEMTQGMLQFLSAQRGITPEEMNARVVRPLPLRRGAKASEQAAAIAFLASEDASFITGAVLVADGGGAIVDAATMAFAD